MRKYSRSDIIMRAAAGILPIATRCGENVPLVLLGLDSPGKGGKWSDFVGSVENFDSSLKHAAVRELVEETSGLLVLGPDFEYVASFEDVTPSGKHLVRYVVLIEYDETMPARFAANSEKTRLQWFPIDNLPRAMRYVFRVQMERDWRDIWQASLTTIQDKHERPKQTPN